jgi:phage tail sheath protein FI
MPPPAKHRDVGPAAVLAAELYCRKRGAMLISDPSELWQSVDHAVNGIRDSGISSPNILSYFPRLTSGLETGAAPRVAGGAIAGLLCKLDRAHGSWEDLDQRGLGFDRSLIPAVYVDVQQAQMLVREGFNVIAGRAGGCATLNGSVTMGRRLQLEKTYASLSVRRFCLMVTNTIDRATRWAVFEPNDAGLAKRIQALVHAYMCSLADAGAFVNDRFTVQCDAGLHSSPVDPQRGVSILLEFHPAGADDVVSLTLHQTASGCRVATTAFAPVADCA